MLPSADSKLVQIVDHALDDAARRSGAWLVCHPGCTQCCTGVFAINQLDAARLRHGMSELVRTDAPRAAALGERVQQSVARLTPDFPGDPATGVLGASPEADALFEDFANDEICPVLNPATGRCDLYSARPMACRIFGPPARTQEGFGVCELCYRGATGEEIAACEMKPDPADLESKVLQELELSSSLRGHTVVGFALLQEDT